MANRPVSSSERKGVLIVAGIALVVTLCGLGVAWCGRPAKAISPHDVEVLVDGDTAVMPGGDSIDVANGAAARGSKTRRYKEKRDSVEYGMRGKKSREGKKKKKASKEKKSYGRRSPLDEKV